MKSSNFLIVGLLLIPGWLLADNPSGKTEVTIYSGLSFLNAEKEIQNPCPFCEDPSISPLPPFGVKRSFDSGFLVGFQIGHYLNSNVEVEGNFAIAPNQNVRTETTNFCPPGEVCPLAGSRPALFPVFFEERGAVSYYYDGNFVYNFPFKNITPFATAGLGGITNDVNDVGNDTQSDFAFNFGAGVKSYFKNVGVRFEVNDHVISSHFLTEKTEHDVQVHYGFLFRL